ncbi:MAG: hypothetical protein Q8O37_02350 [Sulfuricellaceae bacterium]|nr:hypothetical protein [Sulfuricellaceae bacterium]
MREQEIFVNVFYSNGKNGVMKMEKEARLSVQSVPTTTGANNPPQPGHQAELENVIGKMHDDRRGCNFAKRDWYEWMFPNVRMFTTLAPE